MLRKQFNVAALYTAASGRLAWTKAQLRPYVVHDYDDEQTPSSWMFDTFLLLDFKVRDGNVNYSVETSFLSQCTVAKKSHWIKLMDSYFGDENATDSILSRLDEVVGEVKQELGNPGFKHKVILCVPEPISCYVNPSNSGGRIPIYSINDIPQELQSAYVWNDIREANEEDITFFRIEKPNGGTDAKHEHSACSASVKWFVHECVTRWLAAGFENLDLVGFYWIGEGSPGWYVAFDTFLELSSYIHEDLLQEFGLDLFLCFAPYSSYYWGVWTDNGQWTPYRQQCPAFDLVFAQPGYSASHGADATTEYTTRLLYTVNLAASLGDGVVFETDEHCLYGCEADHDRYLRVGRYLDVLNNRYSMSLFYYMGNGLLAYAYDAQTPKVIGQYSFSFSDEDYEFLDRLAGFISRRRHQIELYNNADVNEDGDVDVVDLNIVLNEMLGYNTGYSDRADVNQDGSVDISDYNAAQNVMLGGLANI
ncbi:MAG: DUF4855 domain-containing protein [Muribaculaceae bacterium]|nr:DUF4855 domain-containing protein [Muribaculaceae bacterium]